MAEDVLTVDQFMKQTGGDVVTAAEFTSPHVHEMDQRGGKFPSELIGPKPGQMISATPGQEKALQQDRSERLAKESSKDFYSGSSDATESFFQAILPIRTKELQKPGATHGHEIASAAGQLASLLDAGELTKGVFPAVSLVMAKSKLFAAL